MQLRWDQQLRKVFFPYLNDRMWRNPQLKSGVPGMFYLGKWLCIFSNPSLIYYPLLIYILLFQTQLFRRVMPKKASLNLKSLRQHLRMKGRPTRLRARARMSPFRRSRMSSHGMMKMWTWRNLRRCRMKSKMSLGRSFTKRRRRRLHRKWRWCMWRRTRMPERRIRPKIPSRMKATTYTRMWKS